MGSPADDAPAGEDFSRPPWGELGRDFTLGVVSGGCNLVLRVLNSLRVHGGERFRDAVLHRQPGQALFTVCNHTSTLDDPAVLVGLLPWSFFWTEHRHRLNRWSLCAQEICYSTAFRTVFQNGKVLPIDRAGGIDQPIMRQVGRMAARGDWVHVFPEARISYSGRLQPLRRGIGKLVCDSLRDGGPQPVVLPFYHSGMGDVLPKHSRVPRAGQVVTVTVGRPLELGDLTARCNCREHDQRQVWADITARVAAALAELEAASPPNRDQTAGQGNVAAGGE